MRSRSAGSASPWIYAIIVALIGFVGMLFAKGLGESKQSGVRFPTRTSVISAVESPTPRLRIQSEPIRTESISVQDLVASNDLGRFRTIEPTRTLALSEPSTAARILAPVTPELSSPFQSNTQTLRSIAESGSAGSIPVAIPVANAKPLLNSTKFDRGDDAVASSSDPLFHRKRLTDAAERSRLWPLANRLIASCTELREFLQNGNGSPRISKSDLGELIGWVDRVQECFEQFAHEYIGSNRTPTLIEQAKGLAGAGFGWAESHLESSTDLALEVSQVAHGIQRRVIVWDRVFQCMRSDVERRVAAASPLDLSRLAEDLAIVRNALEGTADADNWSDYLLLERLEALSSNSILSYDEQVAIAREFLSRVTSGRINSDQKKVLDSREIRAIAEDIHPLTVQPVDYRKLLVDIESLEENPVHRCSESIADAVQSLRFSSSEGQYAIANAINQQYRNANIRLSVSEEFINRMMPKDQVTSRPVQQRILGADTRGASKVKTNMRVDILPDPSAWKIALHLDGKIESDTRSIRSGATFYNSSNTKVQAAREIRIDPSGLTINGSPASVQSQDSLRKFSTNWDEMPIVGDMIRYFVHQEFNQKKPIASRISQRIIARQTDDEFDKQLLTKIDTARSQFDRRLIGPMQLLQLEPMILDMQATENRLVARYRLAGVDQIAAYTPRPLAPSDSLISLQFHQSSINNLIAQAIKTDRDWTIRQLANQISDILQQQPFELPADTPEDVIIRFMDVHPMTVEFEDGKMWITLRIASFEQPGRIQLKNFIVRTSYVPHVDGLRAELERDPLISVEGHRLGSKDRFPIRAIFTKVFSGNSKLPMVADSLLENPLAEGMRVSQLEMRKGWFAIAVSDKELLGAE